MSIKNIQLLGIAILGSIAISMTTIIPTAEQILAKAEQKLQSSSVIATMDITIKRPRWTKNMRLKTWSKGT